MNFIVEPVFHPLIQILITFVLCIGILNIGKFINLFFFKNYNYNFFNLAIGIIFLSNIIFFSYSFNFLHTIVMPLSFLIILIGIFNLNFFIEIKNCILNLYKSDYKLLKIISIFFLLFVIISLGPPTMADALNYHLTVPLNILKYKNFPNQDIWLRGSLFGYGELINIIPLYLKTDNFFSFFQLLSLIFFLEYFIKKKTNYNNFYLFVFFIICAPVFIFLISGPKALLFPQLLTAMSLYLYLKDDSYNHKNILIISIFLISATQFKLSFILSGSILMILILKKTFNHDKKNIISLFIIVFIIFCPRIFYNFNQISSFTLINIFTTAPINFLDFLKNFKDNHFFFQLIYLYRNQLD